MLTLDAPEVGQAIRFIADEQVHQAIVRIGRTEDVCFSPDGRRIALAGYHSNRVLLLDFEAEWNGGTPRVTVSRPLEVACAAFAEPHGITWVDDRTLIVGSREGHLAVLRLPNEPHANNTVSLEPIQVIGADGRDLISSPGSLLAVPIGMGLVELLVCNNYVDTVSRHLLDRDNDYAVLASEILLSEGLKVPDGVAQSRTGQWIAVSNHHRRNVLLFRNDAELDRFRPPDGILAGASYPHGVQFSADEKTLIVSDAGAPFVQIFRSPDGDWSGHREPSETIRVMSDDLFVKGFDSPMEGGPKGIDLSRDNRLLVATCKMQRLAFFDVREHVGAVPSEAGSSASKEAERARAAMIRHMKVARTTGLHESEASWRATEGVNQRLEALLASRSWRLTAPIRWLVDHYWALRWELKRRRHRFP
jgi:hypothetical protein